VPVCLLLPAQAGLQIWCTAFREWLSVCASECLTECLTDCMTALLIAHSHDGFSGAVYSVCVSVWLVAVKTRVGTASIPRVSVWLVAVIARVRAGRGGERRFESHLSS
jgi:hypothetical protein